MSKDTLYDVQSIKVLTDREHVRLRTPVYLGSVEPTEFEVPIFYDGAFRIEKIEFIPAVYKAINEIIDNSVDEFAQIMKPNKKLQITANTALGEYTVADNGRGVPIGLHETGKHAPEIVFGSLRSGRNFTDDKAIGVIGQNGVGSACTNYCSASFHVDIHRDGQRYQQEFTDGAQKITKPSIKPVKSDDTGTKITFQLDNTVFKSTTLPSELMINRAAELALTNPSITVEYNHTKFRFRHGFEDVVRQFSKEYYRFFDGDFEFFVIFDVYQGIDEKIFTYVNSSLLFDGGVCNTQFTNAFYEKVIDEVRKEAKKQKCEVTKNDVRANLLIIGNMRISDPTYDSQSKTRLIAPGVRKELDEMIAKHWKVFARRHQHWFEKVLERAARRYHSKADEKAVKDLQKMSRKKIEGLRDATGNDRKKCICFVTEGDSAASSIREVRDAATMGSFPLTGKVNNVHGCTISQILEMSKVSNLFAAMGLIPGKKANRDEMHFGKMVISTDADPDGSDIFSLLANMFYTLWPELFNEDNPFIYRLIVPNVVAVKGNKRAHFVNRQQYEESREKYKGWEIMYCKGLGSMETADWQLIIEDIDNFLLPIVDDKGMKDTLELLFGNSADKRKEWLQSDD